MSMETEGLSRDVEARCMPWMDVPTQVQSQVLVVQAQDEKMDQWIGWMCELR